MPFFLKIFFTFYFCFSVPAVWVAVTILICVFKNSIKPALNPSWTVICSWKANFVAPLPVSGWAVRFHQLGVTALLSERAFFYFVILLLFVSFIEVLIDCIKIRCSCLPLAFWDLIALSTVLLVCNHVFFFSSIYKLINFLLFLFSHSIPCRGVLSTVRRPEGGSKAVDLLSSLNAGRLMDGEHWPPRPAAARSSV